VSKYSLETVENNLSDIQHKNCEHPESRIDPCSNIDTYLGDAECFVDVSLEQKREGGLSASGRMTNKLKWEPNSWNIRRAIAVSCPGDVGPHIKVGGA